MTIALATHRLRAIVLCCLAGLCFATTAFAQTSNGKVHVDIAAQSLSGALTQFGRDTGTEIVFTPEAVNQKLSTAIKGDFTKENALALLLAGTGLTFRVTQQGAIVIDVPTGLKSSGTSTSMAQVDQNAAGPTAAGPTVRADDQNSETKKKEDGLSEIVVTGTHIHGVSSDAPTTSISRQDIQESGYTSLEQVVESLPQNYHGITMGAQLGDGLLGYAGSNYQQASSIDLRGLGPDSTLVLLNGMRQVGVIEGRAVDVSVIPVSVIERIDVVTGGNSAVYGSDAVAGVVNFVTRRDFEGAETQASFGGTANGGNRLQASQVFGMKSDRGGFVMAYDYSQYQPFNLVSTGLTSTGFYGSTPLAYDTQPDKKTHAGYLSGHYQITDGVELYTDTLYTHDTTLAQNHFNFFGTLDEIERSASTSTQYNTALGALMSLPSAWKLNVSGNYSHEDTIDDDLQSFNAVPNESIYHSTTGIGAFSAVADGPLLSIASRELRVALGADWRDESHAPGFPNSRRLSRTVSATFLEGHLPLVTDGERFGLRQLDLSGAVRYDHYSDFGGTTNEQFGLSWSPLQGVNVRSSYATSFRAPDLYTLGQYDSVSINEFSDPKSPSGSSPTLYWTGTLPVLRPETARTWTIGADFHPAFQPQTKISIDYVHIDYKNRVDFPDDGFTFGNELQTNEFAPFTNRNPTNAELAAIVASTPQVIANYTGLPYNPATQTLLQAFPNLVVLDMRAANLATETYRGIDAKGDSSFDTMLGIFKYGLDASYTLDHQRQLISEAPWVSLLNDVGKPVRLRLRANAGWQYRALGAFTYVNYVQRYKNTLFTPETSIPSWTTADFTLSYDTSAISKSKKLGHGLRIALSLVNAFNRLPPRLAQSFNGINYDAANANPFGRLVTLQATKGW